MSELGNTESLSVDELFGFFDLKLVLSVIDPKPNKVFTDSKKSLFCCELLFTELLLLKPRFLSLSKDQVFCFKSCDELENPSPCDLKSDLELLPILLEFMPNSLEGLFLELLLILSVFQLEISDCV